MTLSVFLPAFRFLRYVAYLHEENKLTGIQDLQVTPPSPTNLRAALRLEPCVTWFDACAGPVIEG